MESEKTQLDYTDYIKSKPLTELHGDVTSDHVSLKILVDDELVIASWNISNKEYHKYFGIEGRPYANTHLYVHQESPDDKKEWLETKHNIQIDYIVGQLLSERVHIYAIQEAFAEFIETIRKKLPDYFIFTHKKIVTNTSNIAMIITNSRFANFKVEKCYTGKIDYFEVGKTTKRQLYIPTITLNYSDKMVNISCVHVSGNDIQFPKNGINALLREVELWGGANIFGLVLGDFNTTTNNIRSLISKDSDLVVMEPLYPTHINPDNQIVTYDNVLYSKALNLKQLSLSDCDGASQYLVIALIDNL